MTTEPQDRNEVIVDCVSGIVCGYVANNALPASELPALIASVRACLARLSDRQPGGDAKPDHKVSEAQIRESITPDALVSFIDGKPYKTLKRHLRTRGLDQDAYRERYGLPANYPMVAPSYSTRRSELSRNFRAKSTGQGE